MGSLLSALDACNDNESAMSMAMEEWIESNLTRGSPLTWAPYVINQVWAYFKNDAVRMSVCEAFASALESIDGSLECIIVKAIIEQSDNQSVRQSMVETLAVRAARVTAAARCVAEGVANGIPYLNSRLVASLPTSSRADSECAPRAHLRLSLDRHARIAPCTACSHLSATRGTALSSTAASATARFR